MQNNNALNSPDDTFSQNIIQTYRRLIDNKKISADKDQRRVINMLSKLAYIIENNKKQQKTFLTNLFKSNKNTVPKGLYIYGGVGRGKSMLMDLFFENIKIKRKKRTHFHAFMLELHDKINEYRKKDDLSGEPIEYVAEEIAKESSLLCFDELQVTDIADAMILGRLFEILFSKGVIVVATSNRPPDDLYKHGLQREQFLPFIAMFKQKLDVTPLDGDTDYRLEHLKHLSTVYYTPLGKDADNFLESTFDELTNGSTPEKGKIHMQGRTLKIPKMHGDIAQLSFNELCTEAVGSADYIELAREFNTILLSNIPQMSKENRNSAKRFTNLIDELYEHRVKLICTAECAVNELYVSGNNSFEFERTASRLIEMQSTAYLGEGHIA